MYEGVDPGLICSLVRGLVSDSRLVDCVGLLVEFLTHSVPLVLIPILPGGIILHLKLSKP